MSMNRKGDEHEDGMPELPLFPSVSHFSSFGALGVQNLRQKMSVSVNMGFMRKCKSLVVRDGAGLGQGVVWG